ncbi:hypothetical protein [Chryseobacterium aureum]|uniref:hypothetical protein n=1 Tax=Chryseobacterium aureum TaxID=2497456 RepID=UPI000F85C574|nr:hypothetical protein [Chryseobacterium aureum]
MKKIIILISMIAFCKAFTQVGINTTTPTQTLDVNGTVRLRGLAGLSNPPASIPTGTNPNIQDSNNFPNVVVNRIDGTLGSRTFPEVKSDIKAQNISFEAANLNTNLNLTNVPVQNIADIYVVDSGSNITLPTCTSSASMNGKLITMYKWGGPSTNNPIRFIANPAGNIYNAVDPSGGFIPPQGITYNNTGGTNGGGITQSVTFDTSLNSLRFTVLKMYCISGEWFFDHNVE